MQLRILMLVLSVLQGRLLMPGLLCLLVASMAWVAVAEPERGPLILDMHLHAPPAPGAAPAPCLETGGSCAAPDAAAAHRHTQAQLRRYNVIGLAAVQDSGQAMPASEARAPGHLALDPLRIDAATEARVQALRASGQLTLLGLRRPAAEMALDDPRMEPLWQLATRVDLPVGLHLGRQDASQAGADAELEALQHLLARHPQLRLDLVHGAQPLSEALLAVLDAHPQVYLDVGQLVAGQNRPAFYRDLRAILDAGLGDQVMFGSGSPAWPASIGASIDTVRRAPFLDDGQKRDIFYNNAARFLRLERQPAPASRTI
ncbi:amidohydrolase [Pseudoxanthomonas winnipegensis]|uniref:amidohydrolase family protein n=1 Tax=Pseudoxanthomonas winnipegensis TaxID=2480810 RepID=UPI0025761B61|nr:amidohydrolase family protein [Pseudoxanthomonas winnipegensis]WJI15064.1 amidohydrolase [Pseudoxanthomonas winnipegensis]